MRLRKCFNLFIFYFAVMVLHSRMTFAQIPHGEIPPLSEVDSRGFLKDSPVFVFEVSLQLDPAPIRQSFFSNLLNQQLTAEFSTRYYENFGQKLDQMQYHRVQNNMVNINQVSALGAEGEQGQMREFGEYMIKRLSEYHVDEYFKNDPDMRPVYELKEKLSKVHVEVAPRYELTLNYSLVGNFLAVILMNPHVDSKLLLEMDPQSFGPTEAKETRIYLGKQLNPTSYVESWAKLTDGIAGAALNRRLMANVDGRIGASSFFNNQGLSPRETMGEVGIRWNY